jgi:hypothetical protein
MTYRQKKSVSLLLFRSLSYRLSSVSPLSFVSLPVVYPGFLSCWRTVRLNRSSESSRWVFIMRGPA